MRGAVETFDREARAQPGPRRLTLSLLIHPPLPVLYRKLIPGGQSVAKPAASTSERAGYQTWAGGTLNIWSTKYGATPPAR